MNFAGAEQQRALRARPPSSLPEVDAVGAGQIGQPQVVIDDQRHTGSAAQRQQFAGLFVAQRGVGRLVAVLHHGRAARQRRLDHARSSRAVSAHSGVMA